jgi:outer membrane protein TolC
MGAAPLLLALASCASYQPMPITPTTLDRALTVPSAALLERQASELHHPLLQPRGVVLDPSRPLSPDEAAILAVLLNPALRARRDQIGVSSAQLVAAGLLPNPVLNYNLGVLTGGPGTTNSFGIGAAWDVTSLVTRELKVTGAHASLARVRLDVAWAEWQTAEAAKAAVFASVALERELAQAQDIDGLLAENLQLIQNAYARHERTVLQLAAARTASDSAHAKSLSLEQQVNQQRMKLLQALGLPASTPISLRCDILLESKLALPSIDELLHDLADRRLDLIALRRGYASQELNVRVAILNQFPHIDLGVSRAKDNTGVYAIGLSANIVLPIFNRNQAVIAQEQATRQQLFDEYAERIYVARSDVATLLKDVAALTVQIAAAQGALPSLEQLVQTYREAVDRGNADVLSYYSAWNSLDSKRIELLQLQAQLESDRIALELAAGEPLPQSGRQTQSAACAAGLS